MTATDVLVAFAAGLLCGAVLAGLLTAVFWKAFFEAFLRETTERLAQALVATDMASRDAGKIRRVK